MKLKNLKIYLLAIFGIFLLSLKTQAVIVKMEAPLPSVFIDQKPSINGTIRLVREYIESEQKDIIINDLNEMKNSAKETGNEISIRSGIFADKYNLGILVQFITLSSGDTFLDYSFTSKIPVIHSPSLTDKKTFPGFTFELESINKEENKTWLVECLKTTINKHPEVKFNHNLWESNFKFQEIWESTDDNNIHHQYLLINFNTEFLLFDFQTPLK